MSYAPIKFFLCGDVMTGRGVDQALPHPSAPTLYEDYVKSASEYLELAERTHGPIPRPVDFDYIWGDALDEWRRAEPDLRIANLETSITTSDKAVHKGINYRMHPDNVACLTAAEVDCCTLANNHVLDWGFEGLPETLRTLQAVHIKTAGAGRNRSEAGAPAELPTQGGGRALVFAYGSPTSGVPLYWAAGEDKPGIAMLEELSDDSAFRLASQIRKLRRAGDIVVFSIHWGGNWGYEIPPRQRAFAHRLIAEEGADVVFGHSSHHAKGIEVFEGKPILYGCGDFVNDYEGISGHERFLPHLSVMYLVTMDPASHRLLGFEMLPLEVRRFRLHRASTDDSSLLRDVLNREGARLRTRVKLGRQNALTLDWE